MNTQTILKSLNLELSSEEKKALKKQASEVMIILEKALKRDRIKAQVFAGGSYAKDTLMRGEKHDVDIFVRFEKKENLSEVLSRVVQKAAKENKFNFERVHGSRDYFKIWRTPELIFEIIPVRKIKYPKEAENVTDLSYFHVNYVKKKLTSALKREILLAKAFCKAQEIYGAESYVNGFSGYALEGLIIYYKSFEKLAKEVIKARGQIILDPGKHFKKKDEILIELNESKIKSPIVLIDPTWKERNILAALSNESFEKFKEGAKKLIKRHSIDLFIRKKNEGKEILQKSRERGLQSAQIILRTDKQAGDIAGTKLKKFYNFLKSEIEKCFEIKEGYFEYSGEQEARAYLGVKSRGKVIKTGPPIEMREACERFRKENKKVFEREGRLYSEQEISQTAKEFLNEISKKREKQIKEMDISSIKVY